jgi:hypothetical protein
MTWNDVTSAYAGLFFHAEEGGSKAFEMLREENVPCRYIDSVRQGNCGECKNPASIIENGWSENVYAAEHSDGSYHSLEFHTTANSGEVRTRNMAIRIWKRTG